MMFFLSLLLLIPQQPTEWTYGEAFKQAIEQRRPLMVIVTASWCAPCQELKRDTIIPMYRDGDLGDVVLVIIDKDKQPDLAKEIMRGESLPQTVVYTKKSGLWKRFTACGMMSRSGAASFLKTALRLKP